VSMSPTEPPSRENIKERREFGASLMTAENVFQDPEISHSEETTKGADGHVVEMTIVQQKKKESGLRPGIFYIHGGGMILGNRFMMLDGVFPWIKQLDAVLLTPEYRLAPEHQHPTLLNDCWTAFEWFLQNTQKLGIDPERIMIAGHSAGGGLAAGIALMARDRKSEPELHAQLLVYPMLDDRVETMSTKQYMDSSLWSGKMNVAAWEMYLGSKEQREKIEGLNYASPARASDLSGLPETYIEVGTGDTFRDEDIAYASRLLACGVRTELHVYAGGTLNSNARNQEPC
jgi:acetyl esterase/lipase